MTGLPQYIPAWLNITPPQPVPSPTTAQCLTAAAAKRAQKEAEK